MELAAAAIGILIAGVIYVVRHVLFVRNMPDDAKKKELVTTILEMKSRGCGYQERLEWLKRAGLRKDVADVLLGEAERTAVRSKTKF